MCIYDDKFSTYQPWVSPLGRLIALTLRGGGHTYAAEGTYLLIRYRKTGTESELALVRTAPAYNIHDPQAMAEAHHVNVMPHTHSHSYLNMSFQHVKCIHCCHISS